MHAGSAQEAPGGEGGGLPGGDGMSRTSPHSSMESVGAEDPLAPALSARLDPPGQEHPPAETLPPHGKMPWEVACRHGDCLDNRLRLMSVNQCRVVTSPAKVVRHDHTPFPSTPAVFRAHENVPAFHRYNRHDPALLPPKAHTLCSMPPPTRPVMRQHVSASRPAKGWDPAMSRHAHLEALFWENERLKMELDARQDVTLRIQRLDQELREVSDAYNQLIQTCADKEAQEDQQRALLLQEIRRLQQLNVTLRDGLEETSRQAAEEVELADQHQHQMIALITQNEVQQQQCVCLQRALHQLRVCWHELRVHACALERALAASRLRSTQLQKELQTQQACADAAQQLQGVLSRLQDTCARREELERELRMHLQQQFRQASDSLYPLTLSQYDQQHPDLETRLALMTALVHQKDEVICHLQQKLTKLQNLKSVTTSNDNQPTVTSVHTGTESTESESHPVEAAAASTPSTPSTPSAQPTPAADSTHSHTPNSEQQLATPPPNWIEGLDDMPVETAEVLI